MNDDKTYNGWANYETWLFNAWKSNDNGSYESLHAMAVECLQDACDDSDDDDSDDDILHVAYNAMADMVKSDIESEAEGLTGISGFWADIINAALSEIDYREIARHYIDDLQISDYRDSDDDDSDDDSDDSDDIEPAISSRRFDRIGAEIGSDDDSDDDSDAQANTPNSVSGAVICPKCGACDWKINFKSPTNPANDRFDCKCGHRFNRPGY